MPRGSAAGKRVPRTPVASLPDPVVTEQAITLFLPVVLVNPLNSGHSGAHWMHRQQRAKKDRKLVVAPFTRAIYPRRFVVPASHPKAIHFLVHHRRGPGYDDDALPAVCKHLRDGLVDVGLIDGDARRHGHVFTYAQTYTPGLYGVTLTARCAETAGGGDGLHRPVVHASAQPDDVPAQ